MEPTCGWYVPVDHHKLWKGYHEDNNEDVENNDEVSKFSGVKMLRNGKWHFPYCD